MIQKTPLVSNYKSRTKFPTKRTSVVEKDNLKIKNQYYIGQLRVIVLGGLEEVGRNMTVIEYEKEIIIIDMGLQFPEEDMPGIDYIIPNVTYLEDKIDRIKAVFITHGHYDHIGGIPHIMVKLVTHQCLWVK